MLDDLDPRSPVPLYEQIAGRIRLAVAAPEYAAGDALPAVRQLASSLRVTPATGVAAYRDLEREGFVEMRHGAGTIVRALPAEKRGAERTRQARELARATLSEAARLGIAARDLLAALRTEMGGDDE